MMTIVIVLLIILGLILLLLEFFVIPGVTVVGFVGTALLAAGIFIAYRNFGATGGHITLVVTLIVGAVMLFFALRANTWNRLALKSEINSSVVTVNDTLISAGDVGVTVSRLNPIGKAIVNNQIVEAHCPGRFINENTEIEVVKVFKTYVIVKPKN